MRSLRRDPAHIAETLKRLRQMFRLTQENLANAANVSTRTIEKAESGRHTPDEQTLRSIARALGMNVEVFDKPTADEEALLKKQMLRAVRKTAVFPTNPIRTAKDFLQAYGEWHGWRIDTSAVASESALELSASVADWLADLDGAWAALTMSQKLESARSIAELCIQIENNDHLCHIGHYRQRLRDPGKSDLVLTIGMMSVRPKADSDGVRYALVELEGRWETPDDDLPEFVRKEL